MRVAPIGAVSMGAVPIGAAPMGSETLTFAIATQSGATFLVNLALAKDPNPIG
jgi:hypothetical protein